MEELTRAERILEAFIASGKLMDLGIIMLRLAITVTAGLIVLRIVLKISRRALEKSSLDTVLHFVQG